MLHRIYQFLSKYCGVTHKTDSDIPESYLLFLMAKRALWLVQGFVRTGHRVFIGCGVRIDGVSNIRFGRNVTIEPHAVINAIAKENVVFGDNSKIGAYSRVMCTAHVSKVGNAFRLGNHSSCGEFCYFGSAGGIDIGDNVIIGQYVSFHAQNHLFDKPNKLIREQSTTEHGIKIGHNCWIGAKATILDGTIIGNHCVVAAGAVVKGTFPDNVVIGGVPAKILKAIGDA